MCQIFTTGFKINLIRTQLFLFYYIMCLFKTRVYNHLFQVQVYLPQLIMAQPPEKTFLSNDVRL